VSVSVTRGVSDQSSCARGLYDRVRWAKAVATVTSSFAAACTVVAPLSGLTGKSALEDDASVDGPNAADAGAPREEDAAEQSDGVDGGNGSDGENVDAQSAPCAYPGALLCDGFEEGLDAATWQTQSVNATVSIDTAQHHEGRRSLRVASSSIDFDAGVRVQGDIQHAMPLPSPVYIRAFVMFSSGKPQSSLAFIQAVQPAPPGGGIELSVFPTGDYGTTDWAAMPNFNVSDGPPVTAGAWNCVEWEVETPDDGGSVGGMNAWLNGAPMQNLDLTALTLPELGAIDFGVSFYDVSNLPSYDAWFDDIVVAVDRVGCGP
jgi:hypothetical protein